MCLDSDMTELIELRDLALKIAREAGDLLSERPKKFDLSEKSGALDFATQMDQASEELITNRIKKNTSRRFNSR